MILKKSFFFTFLSFYLPVFWLSSSSWPCITSYREWELPFLLAHLSLFSGDGTTPLDMGSFIGRSSRHQQMLYGALSTAVEQYEDLQGNMGLFFLFPDVSIGVRGLYQLGVTLFRINKWVYTRTLTWLMSTFCMQDVDITNFISMCLFRHSSIQPRNESARSCRHPSRTCKDENIWSRASSWICSCTCVIWLFFWLFSC